MSETVESRLAALGLSLPEVAAPAGNYVACARAGNMLFVSGQLPFGEDGSLPKGLLGDSISVEEAQKAAERCALNILAQVKNEIGDLGKIERLAKVTGFVASTPDFEEHPKVINGASDLLANALGEIGKHARAAVGSSSLPFGVPVEVEAIFQLKD